MSWLVFGFGCGMLGWLSVGEREKRDGELTFSCFLFSFRRRRRRVLSLSLPFLPSFLLVLQSRVRPLHLSFLLPSSLPSFSPFPSHPPPRLTLPSPPPLLSSLPKQNEAAEEVPEVHPPEVDEEEDEELLEVDLPSEEDEGVPGVDSLLEELLEVGLEDEVEVEGSVEDEVDRAIEGSPDAEGELLPTKWDGREGGTAGGFFSRYLLEGFLFLVSFFDCSFFLFFSRDRRRCTLIT